MWGSGGKEETFRDREQIQHEDETKTTENPDERQSRGEGSEHEGGEERGRTAGRPAYSSKHQISSLPSGRPFALCRAVSIASS